MNSWILRVASALQAIAQPPRAGLLDLLGGLGDGHATARAWSPPQRRSELGRLPQLVRADHRGQLGRAAVGAELPAAQNVLVSVEEPLVVSGSRGRGRRSPHPRRAVPGQCGARASRRPTRRPGQRVEGSPIRERSAAPLNRCPRDARGTVSGEAPPRGARAAGRAAPRVPRPDRTARPRAAGRSARRRRRASTGTCPVAGRCAATISGSPAVRPSSARARRRSPWRLGVPGPALGVAEREQQLAAEPRRARLVGPERGERHLVEARPPRRRDRPRGCRPAGVVDRLPRPSTTAASKK